MTALLYSTENGRTVENRKPLKTTKARRCEKQKRKAFYLLQEIKKVGLTPDETPGSRQFVVLTRQ